MLFLPLGVRAVSSRYTHQRKVLTGQLGRERVRSWSFVVSWIALFAALEVKDWIHLDFVSSLVVALLGTMGMEVATRRVRSGLPASPFHRIDPQQRSILLLSMFAGVVLLFFSLSTNQEYYSFPAYLPILLLMAATITRAEQTYTTSEAARRWIGFAHAVLAGAGGLVAVALVWGLWSSRHLPYTADVGEMLAHRGVGSLHAIDVTPF